MNANKITYELKPEDAGYKLRATYNANRDYKGTSSMSSATIANADQQLGKVTTEISSIGQYDLKLKVADTKETAAIYEFGYKKSSEDTAKIQSNNVTVTWGKDVDMNNLSRNTDYDFYIRKAAKIGYDCSACLLYTSMWHCPPQQGKKLSHGVQRGMSEFPEMPRSQR